MHLAPAGLYCIGASGEPAWCTMKLLVGTAQWELLKGGKKQPTKKALPGPQDRILKEKIKTGNLNW